MAGSAGYKAISASTGAGAVAKLGKISERFLDQNIFGPKFLLDLSYDSHNTHVQTTFPTDSKQIEKFWKLFLDQNIFGLKTFLVPNIFGPKFPLDLIYDLDSVHHNRFQTNKKKLGKVFWIKIFLDPKCFWSQIFWDSNFF